MLLFALAGVQVAQVKLTTWPPISGQGQDSRNGLHTTFDKERRMKTRLSLLFAAAVIGMSVGPVMAQSHGQAGADHGHYDKQDKHQDRREERHDDRQSRREDRRDDRHDRREERRDNRQDRRQDRRYYGMHDRGRHEGWYHRGGYVPLEYRGGRYIVTDWHREHLRQPPRGYRWVRSDNGDFLLVAAATGIITELLLHH